MITSASCTEQTVGWAKTYNKAIKSKQSENIQSAILAIFSKLSNLGGWSFSEANQRTAKVQGRNTKMDGFNLGSSILHVKSHYQTPKMVSQVCFPVFPSQDPLWSPYTVQWLAVLDGIFHLAQLRPLSLMKFTGTNRTTWRQVNAEDRYVEYSPVAQCKTNQRTDQTINPPTSLFDSVDLTSHLFTLTIHQTDFWNLEKRTHLQLSVCIMRFDFDLPESWWLGTYDASGAGILETWFYEAFPRTGLGSKLCCTYHTYAYVKCDCYYCFRYIHEWYTRYMHNPS